MPPWLMDEALAIDPRALLGFFKVRHFRELDLWNRLSYSGFGNGWMIPTVAGELAAPASERLGPKRPFEETSLRERRNASGVIRFDAYRNIRFWEYERVETGPAALKLLKRSGRFP